MKFSTPDFGPRAVVRYVKVSHVFGGTGNREYIYITSTTKHFYQSTYLGSPVVVTRTTGHPTRTRDKVSLSDIRYPVSVCLSGPRLDSDSLSSVRAPCAGLNRGGRAAVYVGCAPRGGAFGRVDEDLRERHLVRQGYRKAL